MSNPVAPFAVLSGEGTLLETPTGGSVTIKAHTGNTNGSMTVLEFVLSPKEGPALVSTTERLQYPMLDNAWVRVRPRSIEPADGCGVRSSPIAQERSISR